MASLLSARFDSCDDPLFDLAPYEESNEEPTLEVPLTKSDAVYEAHEKLRAGNHEAAGVWFLVAGSIR